MDDLSKSFLPLSRVRTIMKSSPEVSAISQESTFLIAKATELFVKHAALLTQQKSKEPGYIDYKDFAEVVNTTENMEFLQDIVPRKIKAKQYFEMMKEAKKNEDH